MYSDQISNVIQVLTLAVMVIGLGGYVSRYFYRKYRDNVDKQLESKEGEDRIKYFDDCIREMDLFRTTVNTTFDGINASVAKLEKSVAVITHITDDLEPYTKIVNEHSNRLTRLEAFVINGAGNNNNNKKKLE